MWIMDQIHLGNIVGIPCHRNRTHHNIIHRSFILSSSSCSSIQVNMLWCTNIRPYTISSRRPCHIICSRICDASMRLWFDYLAGPMVRDLCWSGSCMQHFQYSQHSHTIIYQQNNRIQQQQQYPQHVVSVYTTTKIKSKPGNMNILVKFAKGHRPCKKKTKKKSQNGCLFRMCCMKQQLHQW